MIPKVVTGFGKDHAQTKIKSMSLDADMIVDRRRMRRKLPSGAWSQRWWRWLP